MRQFIEKFKNPKDMVGKVVRKRKQMSYICKSVSGNYAFIYVSNVNGRPLCYEVWKLRYRQEDDKFNPGGLKFPLDDEFGYYGWCFSYESDAKREFARLVKEDVQ